MSTKTYLNTKKAAENWGCTVPEAREYCRNNKEIIGAFKDGDGQFSPWKIPLNAPAPITGLTLQQFARELLKQKDNPRANFVFRDKDALFSLLLDKGYIALVNNSAPLDFTSYVFTPEGYDFVFSGSVSKALYAPSFSLIGVSISPMAPSGSFVTVAV